MALWQEKNKSNSHWHYC